MRLETTASGLIILKPNWDVPSHVQAFVSTRDGGVSDHYYDSLNLAIHVGDRLDHVQENRSRIKALLPNEPVWLNQVHGTQIWTTDDPVLQADGAVTSIDHHVLAIMTADCMPILFCDREGDVLGVCHAGWRGLSKGVISQTLRHMLEHKRPDEPKKYLSKITIYLGPCIGPSHFEVGIDVLEAFHQNGASFMSDAFQTGKNAGKFYANLFKIALNQLLQLGVDRVFTEEICCYEEKALFFSHRRDQQTGRFASFLWKLN